MHDPTVEPDRAARDAFLAMYRADLARGELRSLPEYQQRFPGHEDEVREEWEWLEPASAIGTPTLHESIGPYRVIRELGRGAQATVYLAEHEALRRQVALKVLHSALLGAGSGARIRFRREAEVTANLEHPGICSVFETGDSGGLTWIAMQFVEGETLAQRLQRARVERRSLDLPGGEPTDDASGSSRGGSGGRSEVMRIVAFVEQAARALHAAHERGLVHRDIKPGNLMVRAADGGPVVLDFGLAQHADDDELALTRSADLLGTPYYMAPEQLLSDRAAVDRRADVWALGVTLYECLSGRRPFEAAARDALYRQILTDEPVSVRSVTSSASRDLDVLLQTALCKDTGRRYQTALALADDLRRIRLHEPILARRVSPVGRLWRWTRRHPGIAASTTVAALALVGGLIVSLVFQQQLADTLIATRALGLANAAEVEVRNDPTRALLLALAANDLEDRVETRSALHHALALCREERVYRSERQTMFVDAWPDGSLIATGGIGGDVTLWRRDGAQLWRWHGAEVSTPEVAGTTRGEDRVIMLLRFVGPARDRIVVARRGGDLQLFDLEGRVLHTYTADPARLVWHSAMSVSTEPGGEFVLVGVQDGVQLLRLSGQARDRLMLVQELPEPGVDGRWAQHPEGRWIATMGPFSRGTLWRRSEAGEYVSAGPLLEQAQNCGSLAFRSDQLLIGLVGKHGYLLDLPVDDRPVSRRPFGAWQADGAAWLGPDRIVGAALGLSPVLWDAAALAEPAVEVDGLMSYQGLKRGVPVVSPGGDRFAAAYQDGAVRVFDAAGNVQYRLRGHLGLPGGMQFVDGGRSLLSWSFDVRLWNLDREDEWVGAGGGGVQFSRGGGDEPVLIGERLWDGSRDEPLVTVNRRGTYNRGDHAFTPDGRHFLVRRWRAVQVYSSATGERVFEARGASQNGPALMLGDTEYMRFDNGPQTSTVVDFVTGAESSGPVGVGFVWSAAPCPGGSRIVTVRRPGIAAMYEREHNGRGESEWHQVAEAELDGMARVVACAPDGTRILLGTDSGRVLAFDRDLQPRPSETLLGHREGIIDLKYSRDGALIASSSVDGATRVWRRDGTTLVVLQGEGTPTGCEFTPDGRYLLTNQASETVKTWPLRTSDLLATARARVSRELTAAERTQYGSLLFGAGDGLEDSVQRR